MKISRIFFFFSFFRKMFVQSFCNILLVKKISLGTLFRKFSFHEKMFLELFDFELSFFQMK